MPEAIPIFDDPYAITITDEESDPNEQRFVTLGWEQPAVCSWSSTGIVTKTSVSSLRAQPSHMSTRHTTQDHDDEKAIRFQQRQTGPSPSTAT
jgi:hypothetical protein